MSLFDKIVPNEAKDFLDDIIPNEIKPYVGTAVATAIPFGGGLAGGFLGSAATDLLLQSLLYGSDEDRDTDYLSAGMSGILGGIKGFQRTDPGIFDKLVGREGSGGLYGEGTKPRFVKPGTRGVTFADTTYSGQRPGDVFTAKDYSGASGLAIDPSADPRFLKPTSESIAQTIGTVPKSGPSLAQQTLDAGYRIGEGGFKEGLSNVFDATMDTLSPLTTFKVDPNAPMGLDNISLGSVSSGLTGLQLSQTPSQVRDAAKALEAAEREYNNYLATLDAENRARIEDDINARVEAHKRFMSLAGFTEAEIDDALVTGGYLSAGETAYAAQGGRIGFATGSGTEDDRDEIAFNLFGKPYVELDLDEREELKEEMIRLRNKSATGGRVGFDMGGDTGGITDRMGLGNYMEAEKVRTEFMDKMKRQLQAAEMNMRLNDPGLMRFINAIPFVGEGFYTDEEIRFPRMKERYEANIEKMKRDQARDDYEKRQLQKQLRKENFDMMVDMVDDRFSDNREQRKMANKGGRMTPQGDPISPDVPNGMQMDLRGGGFIPLGTKPKADDVPAMVGLNEFVLNDEAVSGIGKLITGKPDPRAGARALYQLQDQMEAIV